MRNVTLTVLAVLVLAGAAGADTMVLSGPVYDVFITDPVPVGDGSESLIGFTLYFVNTTADTGYGFDTFDDVSLPAFTGISAGPLAQATGGGLHQHDSTLLGSFSPTLSNANYSTAIDSHFLVTDGDLLNIQAPNETRLVNPSAEASDAAPPFDDFADTSFGNHMGGAFASNSSIGVTTRNLAYLVVRDPGGPLVGRPYADPLALVDCYFLATDPKGGQSLPFSIGTPEPATMSLLAFGVLTALIRRRE